MALSGESARDESNECGSWNGVPVLVTKKMALKADVESIRRGRKKTQQAAKRMSPGQVRRISSNRDGESRDARTAFASISSTIVDRMTNDVG